MADVAPRDHPVALVELFDDARAAALRVCAPIGAGGHLEVLALAGGDGTGVPEPRLVQPGEQVQYPITTVDGREVIAVFSSWWSLLHADPPFPDQLLVLCRALLAGWPAGIGMAFDLGTQHALLLPADDVGRLREAAAI
jgi:hypothetical protein